MHVILDYDVGNLDSVQRGFKRAGMETIISKDPEVIQRAESLILPGVGAFEDAMISLKNSNLIPLIEAHIQKGKYLLGICLGMQLLFDKSYENGVFDGLGFLRGTIEYMQIPYKVPHMGWNELKFNIPDDKILYQITENDNVYFVHSYYANANKADVIAYTNYGIDMPAIVKKDNIYGMQFHPEKSGIVGLNLLKAYGALFL